MPQQNLQIEKECIDLCSTLVNLINEFSEVDGIDDQCIEIYGKSNFINSVFTNLLMRGFRCGYLDFATDYYDDYGREYCLIINQEKFVSIEPVYKEINGVICQTDSEFADVVYMKRSDCSDSLIENLEDVYSKCENLYFV